MKKTSQQDELELSKDYFKVLYRRHFQGALVRVGASAFMWLFALLSYLAKETQINHFIGVSLSVLYLISINPPTLLILKRLKSKRAFKYVSLSINILEILGYTAIIYSLGGVEATFLTPIYAALIVYVGVLGPKNYPYLVASLCSVAFSLMVAGEYFGFLPPQHVVASFNAPWLTIITRLSVVIGLLFVVAYISALTSNILNKNKKKLHEQNLELLAKTALLKKAEKGLRASHQELEKRIEERTQELRAANDQLVVDIDERRQVEEALLESEQKYRIVIENATDAIFIAQDEKLKFANPKTEKITGYSAEELAKISFVNIIHPEDRNMVLERHLRRLKGEEFPNIYSFRILNESEEVLSVDLNTVLISWEGRPATLNFLRDITEQKKLEAQLQQAQKMEAIGTLASGVAHDFNNLLMAIQGRVSTMLMNKDGSDPDFEHLKGIEGHVESAADLTKQLLGIAMGGKYELKPTDLNQLIKKQNQIFGRTKKEIIIREKYQVDLWPVEIDRGQIEQVILNLYVNAGHAMPGGGDLYVETKNVSLEEDQVKPFSAETGRYVKISVADTGVGMDKTTLEKIFDPFFTTKEIGRGTGLGLASVYGIIKNHGGFIKVYSEKGHGTNFNVYFPASEKEVIDEKAPVGDTLMGSETVLFVDDEDMIIEVTEELLKRLGYKVLTARSGKEAIKTYEEDSEQIDIVVLDMIMPDMGGGDTYDGLKMLNSKVKVLLSSGYSIDGQAAKILNRGCNGFIQKPFKMKEFSQKLRNVLDEE